MRAVAQGPVVGAVDQLLAAVTAGVHEDVERAHCGGKIVSDRARRGGEPEGFERNRARCEGGKKGMVAWCCKDLRQKRKKPTMSSSAVQAMAMVSIASRGSDGESMASFINIRVEGTGWYAYPSGPPLMSATCFTKAMRRQRQPRGSQSD